MKNDPKSTSMERCIFIFIALLFAYLLLKYAVGILLPFLIALCVGAIVYPLSLKFAKFTRLPRKLCAAFLLLLFLAGIGFSLFFASITLAKEVRSLVARIWDPSDPIGVSVRYMLDSLGIIFEEIPFVTTEGSSDTAAQWLSASIKQTVSSLCASLSSSVGRVAAAMPKFIISILMTVIACFYTSLDLDKIKEFLFSLVNKNKAKGILELISFALKAYVKAYFLLFILTFFEVLIGLLILRRPYAFIIALLVATVDILPIFGAGTILIPWAIFLFISKQYSIGCGILILYGTVTVIRQIAESHLVGKGLGIHPLASLFCMFAGLKLFGVLGLLLAPIATIIVKEMLS